MVNKKEKQKKVSILLAIYNPNKIWLEELLCSLETQTYENICINAIDDCSSSISLEDLRIIFEKNLSKLEWKLSRNKHNIGSNATFELLTKQAEGDYFAYCDQDDIWKENKIETLVDLIKKSNSVLVYSDMYVINKYGKLVSNSICNIEKRTFRRGADLIGYLAVGNFITGCTMLVESKIAKKSIPFVNYIFHDYWISIIASLNGNIDYTNEALVFYRLHDKNQSANLGRVYTKKDYIKERIIDVQNRCEDIHKKMKDYNKKDDYIYTNFYKWVKSRYNYILKINYIDFRTILKYRNFGEKTVLLEIFLPFLPEYVFECIINLRKNIK